MAFSPEGRYLASCGADDAIRLWNLGDGSLVRTLRGHKGFVNSVAFSPDGKRLVSAGEDKTVKVWNVKRGVAVRTLTGHKDFVMAAVFFPDGSRIASVSTDGTLRLWRAGSGLPERTIRAAGGYVNSVAVSPDGGRVATAGVDRAVKLWDPRTGALARSLEGHSDAVNSVAFSPRGVYLASGSEDGTVKIWRVKDGVCVKTLPGHKGAVLSVAYSPDGAFVFAGAAGGAITAWPSGDIDRMIPYTGHVRQVKTVAVSRDGKYLASGSYDKAMKLWLTPSEADRRNKDILSIERSEAEKDSNYAARYAAGMQAMTEPTLENLETAVAEFTAALSYRKTDEGEARLAEALGLRNVKRIEAAKAHKLQLEEELRTRLLEERRRRARITLGTEVLVVALVSALLLRTGVRTRRRARFRGSFPVYIKLAVSSGDYNNVVTAYKGYRAAGGALSALPQDDLLRLYHGTGAIERLPAENLPYTYLLSYARKFAASGGNRTAVQMLRSGALLDEFREPADYEIFAEIFEKIGRPEHLLMRKFKPRVYAGLAEAFYKMKDYAACEKVFAFKAQLFGPKLTRRETELLGLAKKALASAAAAGGPEASGASPEGPAQAA